MWLVMWSLLFSFYSFSNYSQRSWKTYIHIYIECAPCLCGTVDSKKPLHGPQTHLDGPCSPCPRTAPADKAPHQHPDDWEIESDMGPSSIHNKTIKLFAGEWTECSVKLRISLLWATAWFPFPPQQRRTAGGAGGSRLRAVCLAIWKRAGFQGWWWGEEKCFPFCSAASWFVLRHLWKDLHSLSEAILTFLTSHLLPQAFTRASGEISHPWWCCNAFANQLLRARRTEMCLYDSISLVQPL